MTERVSAALDTSALLRALGGRRGVVDAAVPGIAFVSVNAVAGLSAATWSAVALGAAVLLWRLARRETVQQAVAGFLGIGVAALLARSTGRAADFFLPGIVLNFASAAVFAGSVVVRRPLVGVLLAVLERRGADWHRDDAVRRVFARATLLWAFGVYGLRVAAQAPLWLAGETGWLAGAKLALGWPLTLAAVGLTVLIVRRAPAPRPAPPACP